MKPIPVLIVLTVFVMGSMVVSGLAFQNPPTVPQGVELQGPPSRALDGPSPEDFDDSAPAALGGPAAGAFTVALGGPPPDDFDDPPHGGPFGGPPHGDFGPPPPPPGPRMAALDGPHPGGPMGPPPPHFRKPGPPPLEALKREIGLTDQQLKEMRAQRISLLDKTRKSRVGLFSLMDEKKTMMLSGKFDQDKMAKLDDEIVKVRGEMLKEKLKLERDRLALLNQEQMDRLADVMTKGGPKPPHGDMPPAPDRH